MMILSAVWSLVRDEVIATLAGITTALPVAMSGYSIPITTIDTTAEAVVNHDGLLGWLGFKSVAEIHHQTIVSIPGWTVPAVGILLVYSVWKTSQLFRLLSRPKRRQSENIRPASAVASGE
jgi:hypothetical protein